MATDLEGRFDKAMKKGDKQDAVEKAKAAHRAGAPYKTALDAIKAPTFGKMHRAIKESNKANRAKKQGTSNGHMVVSSLKPAKAKGEAYGKFKDR